MGFGSLDGKLLKRSLESVHFDVCAVLAFQMLIRGRSAPMIAGMFKFPQLLVRNGVDFVLRLCVKCEEPGRRPASSRSLSRVTCSEHGSASCAVVLSSPKGSIGGCEDC